MKTKLKPILLFLLYKVVINQPREWHGNFRWTFDLYPRKISVTILGLICTPFFFMYKGFVGVIESWTGLYRVESYSSYRFYLPEGEKPTKWQCYEKA